MYKTGRNLYSNTVFNQSPLLLPFFSLVPEEGWLPLFILFDLVTAFAIYLIVLEQPKIEPEPYESSFPNEKVQKSPELISSIYLLNPLTVLSCISHEVGVLERMFIVLSVLLSCKNHVFCSSFFIILAMHHGMYAAVLIPMLALIQAKKTKLFLFSIIKFFLFCLGWIFLIQVYTKICFNSGIQNAFWTMYIFINLV